MDDAKTQKIAAIKAAWHSNKTRQEITTEFNISYATLQKLAVQHGWPKKPQAPRKQNEFLDTDPSPEELADRAAEIRLRWSPAETMRRWVGPRKEEWKIKEYAYNPRTGSLEAME